MLSFTKFFKKIPVIKFPTRNFSRIGIRSNTFKKEILKPNIITMSETGENKILIPSRNKSNKMNLNNLYINEARTEFNERLNSKKNEIEIINEISQNFYSEQFTSKDKKLLWVTHDAPTLATGKPHLVNLYNKVLKDTVNRLKILQGHRVHYQIGFDCFGVTIEDFVANLEKSQPIKTIDDVYRAKTEGDAEYPAHDHKKIDLDNENILSLRRKCRDFVIDSMTEQVKYFLRMGIMFDINSIYSTLNNTYQQIELEIFKQLYEKGLVYRDYRVIYWSAEEKRILDLEDLEEKTELQDCMVVKFPIKSFSGESRFLEQEFAQKGKQLYLLGFIQEPWKYVGVRSLSINPDTTYCIAKIKEDYCICAYKRLPELARRSGEKSPEILLSAKGSSLSDLMAVDPIFKRDLPIILDKDISEFFGTCINIISPAHDFNSERLSRGYNLSLEGFLDENNYFKPGLGIYFHKTHYLNGNYKVLLKLKSMKSLFANWKFETLFYSNKHTDERIVLRSIPSWFLTVDKNIKNECIKELSFTHFYPELNFDQEIEDKLKYQPGKAKKKKKIIEKVNRGYKNVVEELDEFDEWCISEINSWGVPIPYFVYKSEYLNKTDKIQNEVLINSEIIDHTKNLFAEHGSDIWWTWPIEDLLPEKYKHEAAKLEKGKENFDSSFDSSISWFVILYDRLGKLNKNNSDLNKGKENLINQEILSRLSHDPEFKISNIHDKNNVDTNQTEIQTNILENKLQTDLTNLISARTKEHLKDYNNQLKEFILNEQNIYKNRQDDSELSQEEEENMNKQDTNLIIENKKIKSLIPKNILFNHISFKCLNYSTQKLFPADILIEGNTQHSYWFIHSIMTSLSLLNQSCFRSVKTHGYIEDTQGNKLTIDKKNFIDPLDIIDGTVKMNFERKYGYGADTVRLFLLRNETDTNFSLNEEFLEKSKFDLKQIRKMAKKSLSLINDLHYDNKIEFSFIKVNILDQIIINDFIKFYSKISDAIQKLNFKQYLTELIYFTEKSFFDFYLTAVKNRIILRPAESEERRTSQFVLMEIFYNLLKLFSPIIPFTTEEIYKNIKFPHPPQVDRKKYLGLEDLPKLQEILEKFKFRYNKDFIFNAESLLLIRREISLEIGKLSKSKKFPDIRRSQINLIFQIPNVDSYEYKILKSLREDINDFFGLNNVSIVNEYVESENNIFITRKSVSLATQYANTTSDNNPNKEIVLQYTIERSGMKMCVRCYGHNCKKENEICEVCKNDIKANINLKQGKLISESE